MSGDPVPNLVNPETPRMTRTMTEYDAGVILAMMIGGASVVPAPNYANVFARVLATYHALAERTAECERLAVRERQALDAHAASFSALAAISRLTALGGEVDEYDDVVKAVASALGPSPAGLVAPSSPVTVEPDAT